MPKCEEQGAIGFIELLGLLGFIELLDPPEFEVGGALRLRFLGLFELLGLLEFIELLSSFGLFGCRVLLCCG